MKQLSSGSFILMDKELKALFKTGGHRSEQAVVGHALEVLLAANPALRLGVAVELYNTGEVTLVRAAEIGDVSAETFKDHLHKKGMKRTVDLPKEEVVAGAGRCAGGPRACFSWR
ncbi:MAG: hypothetical protein HOC74_12495 [Gemmatimonadetes bacterium]|nr:hypothetical protein [Gemmatimonadota bacterium]